MATTDKHPAECEHAQQDDVNLARWFPYSEVEVFCRWNDPVKGSFMAKHIISMEYVHEEKLLAWICHHAKETMDVERGDDLVVLPADLVDEITRRLDVGASNTSIIEDIRRCRAVQKGRKYATQHE